MSTIGLHPALMLTVPEVARRLGRDCDLSRVYDLLHTGQLHAVYPTGRHGKIRIRLSEVDTYLARRAADTRAALSGSHTSTTRITIARSAA